MSRMSFSVRSNVRATIGPPKPATQTRVELTRLDGAVVGALPTPKLKDLPLGDGVEAGATMAFVPLGEDAGVVGLLEDV